METWLSGLKRTLGKRVSPKGSASSNLAVSALDKFNGK